MKAWEADDDLGRWMTIPTAVESAGTVGWGPQLPRRDRAPEIDVVVVEATGPVGSGGVGPFGARRGGIRRR